MNEASYCYVMNAESMGTFSNFKNGERVAGLTGKDINGNWKRFRFENVIRHALKNFLVGFCIQMLLKNLLLVAKPAKLLKNL